MQKRTCTVLSLYVSFIPSSCEAIIIFYYYISDLITPLSEFDGRADLLSATQGLYDVPRIRTLMSSKAFSVASTQACYNLPINKVSSATAFKHHFQNLSFKLDYININPEIVSTKDLEERQEGI